MNRFGAEMIGSSISGVAWHWREDEDEPTVREDGIPILFDLLCGYQGLLSDIAFRGVVGEPDREYRELFEKSVLVCEAQVKSIKPGMTAAEAEAACLQNIEKAVGSWDKYWSVHGCGFHNHEFPIVGSEYVGKLESLNYGDYVFEAGQVLSVEALAEQAFVLEEDGLHRLGGELPMKIYSA